MLPLLRRMRDLALELEQQTEESRAEAERIRKSTSLKKKKAEAKQARAEAKAKESVNDKQAIESSMDRFELGQSAEQQLSGQEDIFGSSDADDSARYSKTNKGEPQNLYVAHNLSADNLTLRLKNWAA